MSLVAVEIREAIAVIHLDNPPLNLFTRQMTADLGERLLEVEGNESVRVLVVCGRGPRAFSAGSDVREFPELMERGSVVEEKLEHENLIFNRLAEMKQPTIAAISGTALGGGAELALCCDYRLIEENATIGFPEILLGTVPGSGGLSRLTRLINPSRAIGLLLDGRPISALRALEIGLANEVVADGTSLECAVERASLWAKRPTLAARAIKRAVLETSRDAVLGEIAASLAVSRAIFASDDMREGVTAFIEKRAPRFSIDRAEGS
jgi:enoyl-CoA hydratase/carnithine racemase